jgi:tripartite ATP-independent transporter DctM subunit
MSVTVYLILTALLFVVGCPLAITFLSTSMLYFFLNDLNPLIAVKIMMHGNFSFILIAIPFFILAAQIMNEGNITRRMFAFADRLVGHIPGGLAHVNILTSVIFSGMSGSAIADTSGIGAVSAKAMEEKGFDRPFSAATTISSAIIGPIIPPSIPMVLYAAIAGASVGDLFIGAIIPGLLMAFFLAGYVLIISVIRAYPRSRVSTFKDIAVALREAFFPLLTPIILVGGIYTGLFTPTEAAVVSSLYAFVLVFLIERTFSLGTLLKIGIRVLKLSANVLILIGCISIFSWIITSERLPHMISAAVVSLELSKPVFLLVMNCTLLLLGCFLETNLILIVFTPMIVPILAAYDISLVHFGVVMVLNLMIGLNTPPFGLQLFIASEVMEISISRILRESWPMVLILIMVLLLITFIESLVMWLPGTMV